MSTVVLSGQDSLFKMLRKRQNEGEITGVMLSWPEDKNYHPFYGMNMQQMLRFIRMAADETGYGRMVEQILIYAAALLNIISMSYPISLSAMTRLLHYEDDYISNYAMEKGCPNVIVDNIRGNSEAGIALRRICESLEEIFKDAAMAGRETKYNIQSGALGHVPVMVFYSMASNQRILNSYLKEELFSALKRVSKIRVVLDDTAFVDQNDELLTYLFQMKRMGKIELVLLSSNAKEMVYDMDLNFANIVLFHHEDMSVTEELSNRFWGKYQHAYPVPVTGKPPAVFGMTMKTTLQWQIATEERLRVRAEDMYKPFRLFFKSSDSIAIKTGFNDGIYLVESAVFLPKDLDIFPVCDNRVSCVNT